MIESTSSWTKASLSKPNFLTANCVIAERNPAPGISECFSSQASNHVATPLACGIPPIPAGCSNTRLLSVTANCPSRKNPSRGVVAIQLGLPRPALRKADWVVLDVAFARLMSSSLISKGLKASNFFSVLMSAMDFSFSSPSTGCHNGEVDERGSRTRAHRNFSRLGQQDYQHHSPDRQQRVPDRVGHRITETGYLALGTVIDHAERGCCGACAGAGSQHDGIVEPEQILADVHRQDKRHRCNGDAPEKQAEAELL